MVRVAVGSDDCVVRFGVIKLEYALANASVGAVISTMVGAIVCWNSKEGECRRRYVFVDGETQWPRLY